MALLFSNHALLLAEQAADGVMLLVEGLWLFFLVQLYLDQFWALEWDV